MTSLVDTTEMKHGRKPSGWMSALKWPRCRTVLVLGVLAGLVLPAMAETKPPVNAMEHWAFHPPRDVTLPVVKNQRWPRTDIDRFILAKLEAVGATPAPAADPRTLIRRMSFDLTGLPPTVEEAGQFEEAMATDRDRAIQELIDRLLTSPRYGERWGRHWLDVARYSDTKGYVYARADYVEHFKNKKDPSGRHTNPVMAAMLKSMDDCVGVVVNALDDLKLAENTVVIFYSDNGGNTTSLAQKGRLDNVLNYPKHVHYDAMKTYREVAGFQGPTRNAPLRRESKVLRRHG